MEYKQLDHEAIWKAYPTIVNSCDTFVNYGLDKDGNKVYWEQSKVDAARNELNKLTSNSLRSFGIIPNFK